MPSFNLTADVLIRKGFLFKEATKLFTTETFADWWQANGQGLDRSDYPPESRGCSHSFPKSEHSRRRLQFPNPGNYTKLAVAIEANWAEIYGYTQRSTISLSTLEAPSDRAVGYFRDPKEMLQAKLSKRVGRQYYLHVDIAQFFPSVYLHRFEAIFPGRSNQQGRNDGLGSKLDNLCRAIQGRESIGLPLGPDTSFVLAEILGAYIDGHLPKSIISAVRHVDDISIYANNTAVLEKCLVGLRRACDSLRLELHSMKTFQGEVPDDLEPIWVSHIRPLAASVKSTESLLTFCDRVFASFRASKDGRIINYSISAMTSFGLRGESWAVFQSFLLTCLQVDSKSIARVGRTLVRAHMVSQKLDTRRIISIYSAFIVKHAEMNHGYEVTQAIWTLSHLGLLKRLGTRTWSPVCKMTDNFVAVTVLWLRSQGEASPTDVTNWRSMARASDGYSKENWLLCHESRVQGWFKNLSPPQSIFWQKVLAAKVSFINQHGWLSALSEGETHEDLANDTKIIANPAVSFG